MKIKFYTLLLCYLTLNSICSAATHNLEPSLGQRLAKPRQLIRIHKAEELPIVIVKLCADFNGRLASPGERWEATDVIDDSRLPLSRIIWAVKADENFVVHYERGGRVHSSFVLVAKETSDGQIITLWRADCGNLKNYSAFIKVLLNNDYDDDPNIGY